MLTLFRNLLFLIILSFSLIVQAADKDKKSDPGLNEASLKGIAWRNVGPAMTAGRIADIAISHEDRSTWYVGVGSGGVWKQSKDLLQKREWRCLENRKPRYHLDTHF